MVKKIKFALEMKDGVKVRTLEELRNNFDLEKAVGYFLDGRLEKWLEDRYYEKEIESLRQLKSTELDIDSLCNILDVPCDENIKIDVQAILHKQEKLDKLKQLTTDKAILQNIDCVAFTQEELENIVKQGTCRIYLYGQNFVVPVEMKNRTYIGIGEQTTVTIDIGSVDELKKQGISFQHIHVLRNNICKALLVVEKNNDKVKSRKAGNLITKKIL